MARQTRVSRREKLRKRFKNERGIFGTKQVGNLCEIFGYCKSKAQVIRAKFRAPKKSSSAQFRVFETDFAPVLAQPAGFPLRSLSASETPTNRSSLKAQTSRNTPSFSLIVCHHLEGAITWRLAAITCVIKMQDRCREQCSQNKTFFRCKILRTRFCRGAALISFQTNGQTRPQLTSQRSQSKTKKADMEIQH